MSRNSPDELTVADLLEAYGKRRDEPPAERGWQGHLYVVPPLPPDKPRRKRWLRSVDDDDLG
jgi:hypothetical protein